MIKITFPDQSVREFESGIVLADIARQLSSSLAKKVLSASVNGVLTDLRTQISEDSAVEFYTFDDPDGKHAFWHTSSHVLAQAVKRLYPQTKLAIGPAIEAGFYYDFDSETVFAADVIEQIEKEVKKIIKENPAVERFTLDRESALAREKEAGEIYKEQLIDELPEDAQISFYSQAEFCDLCAGPHIMNISAIKSFKILSVAGAYWRGSEENKMLQRIYAISFPDKDLMDNYLFMIEEAKKRDHRKLGKELDLFSLADEGPGFPFFHPKGMIVRNELENFWRKEHARNGYEEIKTPIILDADLWRRSGHWDNYKDNMYFTEIDEKEFAVKPMNCPGAMLLYNRKMHSYKDLPFRYAELGLVHRHEMSGALHGLMRVRNFTQDDAHIFLKEEDIIGEIIRVIDIVDYFYSIFGFEYLVELSTKPEKSIGTNEQWEIATDALRDALRLKGVDYKLNEGDGAFYGPKIDFHLKDSIGRTWQCGTIQLDFQMPERFEMTYIGSDGQKHRPIVIHRTVFGSIERFFAILLEHFTGELPLWLAPVQVRILTVNEEYKEYAAQVKAALLDAQIRAETDDRNEKLGYKIREAELQKIPYVFVIGQKESDNNNVSVRTKKQNDLGVFEINDIISMMKSDIESKKYF